MPIITPPVDVLPVDHIKVECAFTTTPDDPAPVWVNITAYVDLESGVSITGGRGDEYAAVQTGSARIALVNTDGRFTPGNTASPYYPNVKVRKKIRVSYANPAGGPVSYRFTGYVEEWPTDWPTGGDTYSACQVSAADRFKRLGQTSPMKSIVEQEYLADAPAAYYTLGEPTGSTTAGDTSRNTSGVLSTTQVGAGGVLTFGANTGPGTDALPAPAFTPTNVTNGKYLSGSVTTTTIGGATGMWLEAYALTSTAAQQSVARLSNPTTSTSLTLSTTAAGKASVTNINAAAAADFTLTSSGSVNDGATHHLAVLQSISAGVITVTLVVDGVSAATTTYAGTATDAYTTITIGGGAAGGAFTGTIAHAATGSIPPTVARVLSHYQAGMTGFAGERSDQRIARLARYAGIPVAEQSLEVGSSTSIAFIDTTGQSSLQAMQDVAATEGGVLFIDGAGQLVFHARSHRYNALSVFTVTAGDIDPGTRFVTNDALLVNDVTASRAAGVTVRAMDTASVTDYGTRAISPVLLTTSDNEVIDAANWKAHQSSAINPRLPNLAVDLLTSPALTAPAVLLGLGSRITCSGLPAQAPAATVDLFLEGWTENINTNTWALAWNTSPASDSSVWQLGSANYSQLGVSTRLAY